MPRPTLASLSYFKMECQIDDSIKMIQAEFGLKGFAVVVKILQKIYGGYGYYCEWNEDELLRFMSESGVSCENKNLVGEIVKACIRRGIFSSEKFEAYGILTSAKIQDQYCSAVVRRTKIEIKDEYLICPRKETAKNANNQPKYKETVVIKEQAKKSKDPQPKPDNRPKPVTSSAMVAEMGFPPDVEEAVKDWILYKIEKRQNYKETGLKALLTQIKNRVVKHGEQAVIDVIRISMANNWQGIIWDRIGKPERTGNAYMDSIKNRVSVVDDWVYNREDTWNS